VRLCTFPDLLRNKKGLITAGGFPLLKGTHYAKDSYYEDPPGREVAVRNHIGKLLEIGLQINLQHGEVER
jgi:hypothetical protein